LFSRDRAAAMAAARSLRTGMTSVNSVVGFAIVPALPFGGVGESGFGRIHGADGSGASFSRPKAITRQRMKPPLNLTSFGRTDKDMRRIVTLVTLAARAAVTGPRGPAAVADGSCLALRAWSMLWSGMASAKIRLG
jgi:hypothetical protein